MNAGNVIIVDFPTQENTVAGVAQMAPDKARRNESSRSGERVVW